MLLEYTLAGNDVHVRRMLRTLENAYRQHNKVIGDIANKEAGVSVRRQQTQYEKGERENTRTHDKEERERTRTANKEARERAKNEQNWERKNYQLKEQHIRATLQQEKAAALEAAKAKRAAEVTSHRSAMDIARSRSRLTGTIGSVAGGAMRTATAVGRGAIALTGLGGGALFASAIHSRMREETSASGLANQMAKEGASTGDIVKSREQILKNAQGVRGFSTEESLEAQRTFGGKAGDYALGGKMLDEFSKVSLATDVSINDVADVAANVFMKLKSENPDQSQDQLLKQVMEAVQVFAGQGNVGSVEMKDLAQYAGRLTAAAAKFEGSRIKNMAHMGALAQIAIGTGTASSAEEATTAAGRFATDLTKHTQAQKKYGIKETDIYADEGKTVLKSIPSIITTMMQKTKGSLPAMTKLMGEESKKMMEGVALEYNAAEKKNAKLKTGDKTKLKEGEAGAAAIAKMIGVFEHAALSNPDRDARAEAALTTSAKQFDEVMKTLNQDLGDKLLPEVVKIIPAIAALTPHIGKLAEGTVKLIDSFSGLSGLEMGATAAGVIVGLELLKTGLGAAGTSILGWAARLLIPGAGAAASSAAAALGAGGGAAAAGGGAATSAAVGAVGAGAALTAAVALPATIALGSIAALGYQQGKFGDKQQSEGAYLVRDVKERSKTRGLYGQALDEEEASKMLSSQATTAMRAGGGTEQYDTMKSLKNQVRDNTNSSMAKPETAALADAMRDLTATIKGSNSFTPSRGDTPAWLGKE